MTADKRSKKKNPLYSRMTANKAYNENFFQMRDDCWFFSVGGTFQTWAQNEQIYPKGEKALILESFFKTEHLETYR